MAHRHPVVDQRPVSYTYSCRDSQPNPDGDSAASDTYTYTYIQPHADPHRDRHSYRYRDGQPYSYTSGPSR